MIEKPGEDEGRGKNDETAAGGGGGEGAAEEGAEVSAEEEGQEKTETTTEEAEEEAVDEGGSEDRGEAAVDGHVDLQEDAPTAANIKALKIENSLIEEWLQKPIFSLEVRDFSIIPTIAFMFSIYCLKSILR